MRYSEKHLHEGKSSRTSEAHHEEVQGRELRGQGNFEWNTDLIETKKLENYTRQVAHGLCSGEAQHERRGAHEEQHFRSLHETLTTQSLARKLGFRILDGTNGDDREILNSEQGL